MHLSNKEKLDQLLQQATSNPEVFVTIASVFADAIADRKISLDYTTIITNACKPWTEKSQLAKGVYHLTRAMGNYYGTDFDAVNGEVSLASDIFQSMKQHDLYGTANMFWGANLRSLGELDEAVEHLMIGAEYIHEKGPFSIYKGYSFYQLAEIYVTIKDFKSAERNYLLAVHSAEVSQKQTPLFRAWNGLGNLYMAQESYDSALEYLQKSLDIATEPSQKSRSLCDLGILWHQQGNHALALTYLEQSYHIRVENQFEDASSTSLIHLSKVLLETNAIDQADEYAQKALAITFKFRAKNKTLLCYKLLAQIYAAKEDWKSAYTYLSQHDVLQDEISSKKLQNIYELKNNQIEKQKRAIEVAHQEIKDSIKYAKRIQTAILPSEKSLHTLLPEHFVMYLPKDVVAGDFYWVEKNGDTTYFAVADCTGHGVPGAMVSVVCHNALNRAIKEYNQTDTGRILDKTREIVLAELSKSNEKVKDGMDIALCALRGDQLQYSGAYNPLWIIRSGAIQETKADKQPIGMFEKTFPFTTHTLRLQKGDAIYLFSDGLVDQFGGSLDRKFGSKRLRDLLLGCSGTSMKEQLHLIENQFHAWMKESESKQIDDVCIMGIRYA